MHKRQRLSALLLRIVNSLMFRLVITNLLVITLVALIDNANYEAVLTLTKQELFQHKLSIAQHTMRMMESRLESVDAFSLRVTQNVGVHRLMRQQEDQATTAPMVYTTMADLRSHSTGHEFIEDYFLYFPTSDVYLTRQYGLTSGLRYVYDTRMQYDTLDANAFEEMLFQTHYAGTLLFPRAMLWEGKTIPRILHVQSLPYDNHTLQQGVVVSLLDMTQVDALLRSITDGADEAVYLYGDDGSLLYTYGDAQVYWPDTAAMGETSAYFVDDGSFISYVRSLATGWTYVIRSPLTSVTRVVDGARSQHVSARVLCIIGCLLLSVLTANWHSRPLRKSVAKIRTVLPDDDGPAYANFHSMHQDLNTLISRYSYMEASMEERQDILRGVFFDALIHGRYEDAQQMRRQMEEADTAPEGLWHTTVMMEMPPPGPTQDALAAAWSACFALPYIHRVSERRMLGLFTTEMETTDAAQQYLVQKAGLFVACMASDGYAVRMTAGTLTNDILRLQQAYIQATHLMNNEAPHPTDPIAIYATQSERRTLRLYRSSDEERLIYLLQTDEQTELVEMLNDVFAKSVGLVDDLKRQQYGQVRATLLRALEMMPARIPAEEVKALQDELLFTIIRGTDVDRALLLHTAHAIQTLYRQRGNRREEQIAQLCEYIAEHLTDPCLGLASCAQQMGRSEVYLSQVFKEQMGINLSTYIENRRMEQARHFVRETDRSFDWIAKACGYNSADTFRKAFKRRFGATPGHYRQNCGEGAEG